MSVVGVLTTFYQQMCICRRFGHIWVLVDSDIPECERIYTAGNLYRHYFCTVCRKRVPELRMNLTK